MNLGSTVLGPTLARLITMSEGFVTMPRMTATNAQDRAFQFNRLSRPSMRYNSHISFGKQRCGRLSVLQRVVLTVGTGVASFFDPTRPESIAIFGELTAEPALRKIYGDMSKDAEGAAILKDKPRINSKTVDLDRLSKLPPESVGRTYYEFLKKNNVSPDSRLEVRYIEDPELAYVMQRYREIHDLVHAVVGQPTNMLGEVVVKWIEGMQTGLPMCVSAGLFGASRLKPKQREKYLQSLLPWAIRVGMDSRPFLGIYYEKRWEESVIELRNYISPHLNKPPAA